MYLWNYPEDAPGGEKRELLQRLEELQARYRTDLLNTIYLWNDPEDDRGWGNRELLQRLTELEARYRTDFLNTMKAAEEEREWLALEVHDRIAQTLAAVSQQLQTMESLAQGLPEIRQVAGRASVLCKEAIRESRNIMNDLRPLVLEDLELIPLIEEELRHLTNDVGCKIKAEFTGETRPPQAVELVLYRIFHEALINIRRHARATEVAVSLACLHDVARLRVEDNGAGFDFHDALAKKRVGGLISMQRRAELAGGKCSFETRPGQGTIVDAWVPLPPHLDPALMERQ